MTPLDFEGAWIYGPKSFVQMTKRDVLWKKHPVGMAAKDTTTRNCPLCATDHINEALLKSNDGWWYVRCIYCGLIYQPRIPNEKKLAEVYDSFPAQEMWLEIQANSVELTLDKRKFRWMLELAGWPGDFDGLCDIGCSTGTMLETADDMQFNRFEREKLTQSPRDDKYPVLVGVEINKQAREIAENRLAGRISCIHDEVCKRPETFYNHLVTLSEVLEHVADPIKLLQEIKPQTGSMLISVPNADSLAVKILHEKCPVWGLGHLQLYTPETLRQTILTVMPEAKIEFYSFCSWAKELGNWFGLEDPFAKDDPTMIQKPETILEELKGYKLLAVVTEIGS